MRSTSDAQLAEVAQKLMAALSEAGITSVDGEL
jgi:hypothetical protein